jgi:hypothetical protein
LNVLAAVRDLLATAGEGKRMELLGPDYRQRRQKQQLELQRLMEEIAASRENRAIDKRKLMNEFVGLTREMRLASPRPETPGVPSETVVGPMPPVPAPDPTDVFVNPVSGAEVPMAGGYRDTTVAQQLAELRQKGEVEVDVDIEKARRVGELPLGTARREEIKLENQGRTSAAAAAAALRNRPVTINTPTGPQLLDRETGQVTPIIDPRTGKQMEFGPTADMRNRQAARALVGSSISAIKAYSDKIMTKVGPEQRVEAITRGAAAVFGNDPEFITYQDARKALAGNLAVAQQGSRPSDADIQAIWLPLVPDAYRDTRDSAAMKWKLIETMSLPPETAGTGAATGADTGPPDLIWDGTKLVPAK